MKRKAIMTLVEDSDNDSDSSSCRYGPYERSAFSFVERHYRSQCSIPDSPTRPFL
jgi:hypothetical protein